MLYKKYFSLSDIGPDRELKVLFINTASSSPNKVERFEALFDIIRYQIPYYKILVLTDLSSEADHKKLENAAIQAGLHMTKR